MRRSFGEVLCEGLSERSCAKVLCEGLVRRSCAKVGDKEGIYHFVGVRGFCVIKLIVLLRDMDWIKFESLIY